MTAAYLSRVTAAKKPARRESTSSASACRPRWQSFLPQHALRRWRRRTSDLDPQESRLIAGALPPQLGSSEAWLPEPDTAWGTLTLATERKEPVQLARAPYPTVTGDYRLFYANVHDAIRGTAPLAIPAEDGFRTIRLLELALQSSHEGRTIKVDFT